MASDYPGAVDTFDAIPATLAGPPTHELLHEEVHNALVAIQTELGTTPSGSAATVAARLDAAGAGDVAYAETTTTTGSITTVETDLTGLSVTFTAVAGRRYRVTAVVEVIDTASSSVYVLALKESATQLHRFTAVNGHTGGSTCSLLYVNNASISGSKTWKLTLVRAGGSGTLSTTNGATYPSFILVEDIGAL